MWQPSLHLLMVLIRCWSIIAAASSPLAEAASSSQQQQQKQQLLATNQNSANKSTSEQQQQQQQQQPNYLETGRQITAILDKFMALGYDKRVRPNYGGPPVEVNVTMRILSISSVSEVMMDFTTDFYFRQTWHDPRLAFKKLGDISTLYVGAEVSKKIWLPDTFFGNEKMAYFHEATTPNVFLRIDHSGEVYRSIRLTVTSSCPMNLQYFPMDRQRCTIEAESYGYNIKDIIYRWARKDTAVERDEQIHLPQFDIVKTVQRYRLEELSSGTYSRLIAEIHFARRMGYYLIQIYIPSSLIVVISWVSFWLHRNASPARVQLGVTTVLTMTTLMSSTNAALPKISYVKSIDIFLGTCFIMVFAALLEYATVGYLGKRIAMRKAHAQHAQTQAQARVFAELQAQGAQGDPVPPIITSSLLDESMLQINPTSQQLQRPHQQQQQQHQHHSLQTGDVVQLDNSQSQQHNVFELDNIHRTFRAADELPPEVPRRYAHSCHHHSHRASSSSRGAATINANNCGCCHLHNNRRCNYQCAAGCSGCTNQHTCSSRTLPRNLTFIDETNNHRQHLQDPPSYCSPRGANVQSQGSKAAVAAAATFVNMHRKNRGLPPSTNPNLAYGWSMGNRRLETIFGIRPSDIDKYSRVVFPVCFVCFQLMYWIVYLHISAFLELEQQELQQYQSN